MTSVNISGMIHSVGFFRCSCSGHWKTLKKLLNSWITFSHILSGMFVREPKGSTDQIPRHLLLRETVSCLLCFFHCCFFFFHRFSLLSAVCLRMTWGSGEKLLPCQLCCDCLLISKSVRGQRLSCLQYMLLCLTPGSMLEKRAKERDTSIVIQILWMWKTNVKRCVIH